MKALAALALLLALTACSGSDSGSGSASESGSGSDDAPAAPFAPAPSSSVPDEATDLADTEACGLVREGIDQFNLGDLDATIDKFEEALPEAEDLAQQQPSAETETLLDAVRYYAELPADEYVDANRSSPEFLRFKTFTLTECAYAGPPAEATEPAIPA